MSFWYKKQCCVVKMTNHKVLVLQCDPKYCETLLKGAATLVIAVSDESAAVHRSWSDQLGD